MVKYRCIGKGTTDNNGIAHLTEDAEGQSVDGYVGVGAGELGFVCFNKERTLLTKTYETLDCILIDNCTISSHNDDYWIHTDATKFVRGEEYTSYVYENRTLTSFLTGITDSCIVDFDLQRLDSNFAQGFLNVFEDSTSLIWFSLANMGLSATTEWLPLRLTITSSSATLTLRSDSTKTITKNYTATGTPNRVRFIINNIVTGFNIRNVKVYPI